MLLTGLSMRIERCRQRSDLFDWIEIGYSLALRRYGQMASVSKESIAQFWLHVLPVSSVDRSSFSVTDTSLVPRLLDFASISDEQKTSPKRRRSAKNVFTSLDPNRLRFAVNIEVIDDIDQPDEEVTMTSNVDGMRKAFTATSWC
jgi:hypothetical protein